MSEQQHQPHLLAQEALEYHTSFPYGKVFVQAKSCSFEQMKFAYSPGVAYACQAIQTEPASARRLTMKGNNVTVITNGTAVLGLGDIGALAGKPVMEGKALLMSVLAGIDATDLCIQEKDPIKLYEIIKACSQSFGCINLEDIKAPGCFELLHKLEEDCMVPVFHDDQDGTAVVATAALLNALELIGKDISQVKVVCSGAGAAMLATLKLMRQFGLDKKHVVLFDSKGLVHEGRADVDEHKAVYSYSGAPISIQEALNGSDVFIGLSAANVLRGEDLKVMNENPVLLTMANPVPEVMPEDAKHFRPDAIVGTGRSDYPNQVNNAMCFPYLFRAVLDAQASKITLNMLKAVVDGIVQLTRSNPDFGKDSIMPNILDPRLLYAIVRKVIDAAINDGVSGEVDRLAMHMFVYRVSAWNKVITLEPKNAVRFSGLNAQWLDEYVSDILDDEQVVQNPAYSFEVAIEEQIEFLAEHKHRIYLFRTGLDVFCVSADGASILGLPVYNIPLDQCLKVGELVGSVDLTEKKAYVEQDLRKAMFVGALLSRLS